MLQPCHPDANFFEKTASGGQNDIILPCIYFHFRIRGISFISTVTSVDNATIVRMMQLNVSPIMLVFSH